MEGECFRLFDLPAELRFKVYDLVCPEPVDGPGKFDATQALRLIKHPLLQASHRLRADILHHQYSSRVTTVFINSSCNVGFDFFLADVAYQAINRIELRIFCSLEQYRDEGKRIILSDYQHRQLTAALSFTDRIERLMSVMLSCSVLPGVMQFPRRPELYQRFQDIEILTKLQPFAIQMEWIPSSTTRIYPDPVELAHATADCEAAMDARLPNFSSLGVRCLNICSASQVRRLQTSSTFGRTVRSQKRTNDSDEMGLPIFSATEKPSNSETKDTSAQATGSTAQQAQIINAADNAPQQPKGEAELAAEKLYEERMEEEYAKREGGA